MRELLVTSVALGVFAAFVLPAIMMLM